MARFLVIAASSDIGAATARLLADAGHEVIGTARTSGAADVVLEATDFDAVDQVFADRGPFDGVVCCAGSLFLKPAHLTSRDAYDAVVAASLTTAFATVRAAGRHLRAGGAVVLVSSAAAMDGYANHEAIAAAKGGVIGLTMSAAATYAPQNLRVNAVAPGLVETKLTAALVAGEQARAASEAMHALPRLGRADDVARMIAFLLDPANDWITGQVVGVDGGLSRVRPRQRTTLGR